MPKHTTPAQRAEFSLNSVAATAALQLRNGTLPKTPEPCFIGLAELLKAALIGHAHAIPADAMAELAAVHTLAFVYAIHSGEIAVEFAQITPEQADLLKTPTVHRA